MVNKSNAHHTQFPQPRRKVSVDLNATVIDFDNMVSTKQSINGVHGERRTVI